MKRDGHENIRFFIGPEVEHTPAYSKRTLFVVGKQPLDEIVSLAREHKTTHIFMGANHSFEVDSTDGTLYWNDTITALLDRGFWVTLDYPAHQHQQVLLILNKGIWQSRIFVPLLSVCIPQVQNSSLNLTVKIDDIDFKATNPGVWCMNFNEVTDSNRFTDWIEYGSDMVIYDEEKPTPMPPYVETGTADINKPTIDLKKLKTKVEENDVKNDASLGLDPDAQSALKAEENATQETNKNSALSATPELAAEAYAEGAKEDPLGKEGSKKKATKK